jgi:cell division protein FtsW (lipid II flippase)
MAHFKRSVDSRAFLVGTSIAVVGALIFQALINVAAVLGLLPNGGPRHDAE